MLSPDSGQGTRDQKPGDDDTDKLPLAGGQTSIAHTISHLNMVVLYYVNLPQHW